MTFPLLGNMDDPRKLRDMGRRYPRGSGRQGEKGDKGDPGDTGLTGPTGPSGLKGNDGNQGPPGNVGQQGAIGPQGPIGLTGAPGATGGLGPQGPKGDTGATGGTGPTGPTGSSGATLLGTVTISESALIAINAGIRKVTANITGTVVGGNYLIFPTAATPTGYALHDAICTTNNQLTVSLTAPLLAIGASYSITCRVVRINT